MSKYSVLFCGLILLATFAVFLFLSHGKIKENKIQSKQVVNMKITSSAFENNQKIPTKYTCDGENINPPLSFSGVPENAESLALIVDDPDAPMGTFVHWVLYNISPSVKKIEEGSLPSDIMVGRNSANATAYMGPCPPSGAHRYFFKLYAIDSMLDVNNANKQELENKMKDHILGKSELIGLYSKN